MALLYRKRIRDTVRGFLAASATGFNARLAAAAASFGVTAFTINFAVDGTSRNFAQSYVDWNQPAVLESSSILDFPGMALYTTEGQDTGMPRGARWFGDVILCIDLILRYRIGMEGTPALPNTEDIMDAAESSVFECINDTSLLWPPGVRLARETMATRDSGIQLSDGFQQVTHLSFKFGANDV